MRKLRVKRHYSHMAFENCAVHALIHHSNVTFVVNKLYRLISKGNFSVSY